MLLTFTTAMALLMGSTLPIRWGLFGFLGAVVFLFIVQAGLNTSMGFEGTSIEESLLLFNGSWVSYLGFNLQITYRAFAIPLLALSAALIFRTTRT